MIFRSVTPIGTSISPQFTTLPVSEKTAVPLLFSVPLWANRSEPFNIIKGVLAKVLTLLRSVGLFHNPSSVVRGRGIAFGLPLLPSIDRTNAVDSPQTKAPAP